MSNLCHCCHQSSGCFSTTISLTIKEQQCVDCVSCEREQNPLLHPSLDPTYLCQPCSDPAIQSSLPDPSRKHSRLISDSLVVRKWGLGLSFTSLFFFHCQYVTQSHAPETRGTFFSCGCGCSQQSQFHWSCSWLQPLLQIEKWTKKWSSVSATSPLSALHLS